MSRTVAAGLLTCSTFVCALSVTVRRTPRDGREHFCYYFRRGRGESYIFQGLIRTRDDDGSYDFRPIKTSQKLNQIVAASRQRSAKNCARVPGGITKRIPRTALETFIAKGDN